MLVLSRRRGESIMIGDDIRVEVADIRGKDVRLAIEAPKQTPVHRLEVYKIVHSERKKDDQDED